MSRAGPSVTIQFVADLADADQRVEAFIRKYESRQVKLNVGGNLPGGTGGPTTFASGHTPGAAPGIGGPGEGEYREGFVRRGNSERVLAVANERLAAAVHQQAAAVQSQTVSATAHASASAGGSAAGWNLGGSSPSGFVAPAAGASAFGGTMVPMTAGHVAARQAAAAGANHASFTGDGYPGRAGTGSAFSNTFFGRGYGLTIGAGMVAQAGSRVLEAGREQDVANIMSGGDQRKQLEATLAYRESLIGATGFVGRGVAYLQDPSGQGEARVKATLAGADFTAQKTREDKEWKDRTEGFVRKGRVNSEYDDVARSRAAAQADYDKEAKEFDDAERARRAALSEKAVHTKRAELEAKFDETVDKRQAAHGEYGSMAEQNAGREQIQGQVRNDIETEISALKKSLSDDTVKHLAFLKDAADQEFKRKTSDIERGAGAGAILRAADRAGVLGDIGVANLEAADQPRAAKRMVIANAANQSASELLAKWTKGETGIDVLDIARRYGRGQAQIGAVDADTGRGDKLEADLSDLRREMFVRRGSFDEEGVLDRQQKLRRRTVMGNLHGDDPNRARRSGELDVEEWSEWEAMKQRRDDYSGGLDAERSVTGLLADKKQFSAQGQAIYRRGTIAADRDAREGRPEDARAQMDITKNQLTAYRNQLNRIADGDGAREVAAGSYGPGGTDKATGEETVAQGIEATNNLLKDLNQKMAENNQLLRDQKQLAQDDGC